MSIAASPSSAASRSQPQLGSFSHELETQLLIERCELVLVLEDSLAGELPHHSFDLPLFHRKLLSAEDRPDHRLEQKSSSLAQRIVGG